jgi:hypothetical protein
MATIAGNSMRIGAWVRAGRALLELYPRGFKLFWLAPLTVGLVILPEFLQHVAEIRLGMFESREAFRELQHDPMRMAFGYTKAAGLFLAFLATARFWWTQEHGGRWWDVRQIGWGRFLLGALIYFGAGAAPELIKGFVPTFVYHASGIVLMLALLPAVFLMLAGLLGDRKTPFSAMWRAGWPWLLLTVVLLVIGFAPLAGLHQMNHGWAYSTGPAADWALMIFDSLVVGLLAGLVGTALYLGYATFAAALDAAE